MRNWSLFYYLIIKIAINQGYDLTLHNNFMHYVLYFFQERLTESPKINKNCVLCPFAFRLSLSISFLYKYIYIYLFVF